MRPPVSARALSLATTFLACIITRVVSQSPSSFPLHCVPRNPSDGFLDPQACAIALNQFDLDNENSTGLFTDDHSQSGAVFLPTDLTHDGCRLRIEILYANQVEQSVHDVWAQGIKLVDDCVMQGDFLGGRILVNPAGLTLSLRPAGDDNGWEERFNAGSVVVGASGESTLGSGVTVTQGG